MLGVDMRKKKEPVNGRKRWEAESEGKEREESVPKCDESEQYETKCNTRR